MSLFFWTPLRHQARLRWTLRRDIHSLFLKHIIYTRFPQQQKYRPNTQLGPSIKYMYVTLFWTNFDPLPHFVTHLGTPLKYVTHLGPPIFSSTCIHTYVFTGG